MKDASKGVSATEAGRESIMVLYGGKAEFE